MAAANSIFGRWDDLKGDENIDFMPTILSRFDMIFIVKDEHNEARDTVRHLFLFYSNFLKIAFISGYKTLARHVMNVHMNAAQRAPNPTGEVDGELSLDFLKRYIAYCRR